MKFGRNLPRNQVPEWSTEYINYKGLKKIIKSAAEKLRRDGDADLAGFFFSLDRNLENVDTFYNKKFNDASRRLKLLGDCYHISFPSSTTWHREELDEFIAALLELRGQLRKLQWYGEVNRRGFIKITKKLDKKIPTACAQRPYIASRVDSRPFATNTQLGKDITTVNEWLSNLAEISTYDDSISTSSVKATPPAPKYIVQLPAELLHDIDLAIEHDESTTLTVSLSEVEEYESTRSEACQRLFLHLLQRAISRRALNCISVLLELVESIEDEEEFNRRNCIHRLVISVGRSRTSTMIHLTGQSSPNLEPNDSIVPAEASILSSPPHELKEIDSTSLPRDSDDTARVLKHLLSRLTDKQKMALAARDVFGRLPLHYAAKYGFVVACEVILDYMICWQQLDSSVGIDSLNWQDLEGQTPLHLSVIGGWQRTTEVLLAPFRSPSNAVTPSHLWAKSNDLLLLATKVNFFNTVKLLLEAGADINYQDDQGETALHISAHFGYERSTKILLGSSSSIAADIEISEKTFGWTPLLVACVNGHLQLVHTLIRAGADVDKVDASGWTAKEHAALRGHLEIAKVLSQYTETSSSLKPDITKENQPPLTKYLPNAELHTEVSKDKGSKASPQPLKSFGHRYLDNETMVLVGLGSLDHRKSVKPVTLENIPPAAAHTTQLDTTLSVVVSVTGAVGESAIVDLPIQDNVSTEPIAFTTTDISNVKLLFDLVPTYAGSEKNIIGRGVALLSSIKPPIGNKMSLHGDISVPIVAAKTLDFIGSIHFNFIVITPFSHRNISITEGRTYWKKLAEPMVIGHRGLGKNMASRKSLQLGENTIQSFVAAANLGASYVEFDVQLTKDHVPVVYHDFLVSETGIDAPVHTLTLEQFLHVNDAQSPRKSRAISSNYKSTPGNDVLSDPVHPRLYRANSLGSALDYQDKEMSQRMRHTRDMKIKGFKGNSRGNFIQAPFTTLEEMLRELPHHIGFNIEIKYPMLFESEEQEMDSYAVELNSFVDTVLKMVYDLGQGRNIIFSSFHPDICLLLSLKQPSIPILFLTDAGASEVGDVRASSLQEAIRFASRWNLLGIVSAAEPLVTCPRLVRVVKESGLVCVSYGTLNNDPVNVQLQVNEGIDAVIVDSVLAIRQGLTEAANVMNKQGQYPNEDGQPILSNNFEDH